MAIATDILIDLINKRIYQEHAYVAGTDTCYSAQELYTEVMDQFDAQDHIECPDP